MDPSFPPSPADPRDLLRLAAQFTWCCGRDLRIDGFTLLDQTLQGEAVRRLQSARLEKLAEDTLYAPERRQLNQALARRSSFVDVSLTLPLPEGRTLNVILSASARQDASGAFYGYTGIGRAGNTRPYDIVQRQELAALLERAEAARDREARLRYEGEILLQSLKILHQPLPFAEKCRAVLAEFAPLLKFSAGLVVRRGVNSSLLTIVSTADVEKTLAWPESPSVIAALRGQASVHSDLTSEIDIKLLPAQLGYHARAALLVPLRIGAEFAVVIALSERPGSFTEEHLAIMQRFALVAVQAFEVEDQKTAVVNASKLSALGEMLATIAHEINQPLSIISMAAQNARLLIELDSSSNEVLEKLDTVDSQARRAGEIVKVIRELAHPNRTTGAADEIDLIHVVATLRVLCESILRSKGINLETTMPEKCRNVRARPGLLEQVLLNLISNAKDAISDRATRFKKSCSGRISISIEDEARDKCVIVRVSDDGGGIPEDVIERIFDPFFTLKDVGKGTGLGLSICRTLLTDIGATLRVENDNEGAVFEIALIASAAELH